MNIPKVKKIHERMKISLKIRKTSNKVEEKSKLKMLIIRGNHFAKFLEYLPKAHI